MSQHWIKSDTIFELEVRPERPTSYKWVPERKKKISIWSSETETIEAGWKRYDYSRPVSTEKLLLDNNELMMKGEEIWYKAELIIHYSTGNKAAHYERTYFKSEDEAAIYAQCIADKFPYVYFQK